MQTLATTESRKLWTKMRLAKLHLLRKEVITSSTSLFRINAVTCTLHKVKNTLMVFGEKSICPNPLGLLQC